MRSPPAARLAPARINNPKSLPWNCRTTAFQKSHIMPGPLSLFSVNAVLVMSADDGSRIFTKYYSAPHPPTGTAPNSTDYPGANPYPTVKEQRAFEKGLLEKTNKSTSDVILYDNRIVVFKMESDVMLYVVGSADENEVLLYNVVLSLRDALGILFKYVALPFAQYVGFGPAVRNIGANVDL